MSICQYIGLVICVCKFVNLPFFQSVNVSVHHFVSLFLNPYSFIFAVYFSRLSLSLSFSPFLPPRYVSIFLLLCLSTFLLIYLSSYSLVVSALNFDFFSLNLWSPTDSFQYVCCISENTSDATQMLVWSPDSSEMANSQACSSRVALFHAIS